MIGNYIFVLLLWLDYGPQVDSGQVLSRPSSWKEAMSFCLEYGGTPANYTDLLSRNDSETKENHELWTSDYAVLTSEQNGNESASNGELYRECSYTYIDIHTSTNETYKNQLMNDTIVYITPRGTQYFDACTTPRPFICKDKIFKTIFLTPQTSREANRSCLDQKRKLETIIACNGCFAFLNRSEEQLQESFEVWTNGERTLQPLTFTDRSYTTQIERVGIYDHNGRFRLVDLTSEVKLSSVCLFGDDRTVLYPNNSTGSLQWIQIFVALFCMLSVALLCSLVARYFVRRRRQVGVSRPNDRHSLGEIDRSTMDVVYANNSAESRMNIDVDVRVNIADYELGKAARRSVSIPACLYDATYSSTVDVNRSEIKDDILQTAEDHVYDNKDCINAVTQNNGTNLYDRANFEDGEPLYD